MGPAASGTATIADVLGKAGVVGADFPAWCAAGSFGGLVCSLVVAVVLAAFAVRQRRGTPRQLANAMVLCLLGSIMSVFSLWWIGIRLDVAGAQLARREVFIALGWIAIGGWGLPLATLAGYVLFTEERLGLGWSRHLPAMRQNAPRTGDASSRAATRQGVPSEPNAPWGRLVPLAPGARPLLLTQRRILLGREATNDVVLSDTRASRYHLELDWDHGHPCLVEQGSMNGTILNGRPLRGRALLRDGDEIAVGSERYRFEAIDARTVGAGSPPATVAADDFEPTAKLARLATPAPATTPLRPLALVGVEGALAGRRWALRGPVVTIGRDPHCTICLDERSVSRLHAQATIQPDGAFLTDLQSSNGTFYNGVPLTAPHVLSPGDTLTFGAVTLRCELARGDEPERPERQGTLPEGATPSLGATVPPLAGAPITQRGLPPSHASDSNATPRLGLSLPPRMRRSSHDAEP